MTAAAESALECTKRFILRNTEAMKPNEKHEYLGRLEDWVEDEHILSADDLDEEEE